MMSAATFTFLSLDFLLMETEASNSALMENKAVLLFDFLFSQISSKPEDSSETVSSMKSSSALSSMMPNNNNIIFTYLQTLLWNVLNLSAYLRCYCFLAQSDCK